MLVMMQYTFLPGDAGRLAYERFTKWTPEPGFEIKQGWTSADNAGGFLLLEVDSFETLHYFSAQFKDMNETLVITPVIDLADGVAGSMKAYAWVDSLG